MKQLSIDFSPILIQDLGMVILKNTLFLFAFYATIIVFLGGLTTACAPVPSNTSNKSSQSPTDKKDDILCPPGVACKISQRNITDYSICNKPTPRPKLLGSWEAKFQADDYSTNKLTFTFADKKFTFTNDCEKGGLKLQTSVESKITLNSSGNGLKVLQESNSEKYLEIFPDDELLCEAHLNKEIVRFNFKNACLSLYSGTFKDTLLLIPAEDNFFW